MKLTLLLTVIVLELAGVAAGRSWASAGPPPFDPWRYDEDYSYLRDKNNRTGQWWESFKLIPLDDDGEIYLSVGADLRVKYEAFTNDLWGGVPEADHDYYWIRALPYADLHAGRHIRVFSQLIFAFEFDDEAGKSPIDENRADALQLFIDGSFPVGHGAVTLRGGRQVLSYGSGRLISTRYGPNVMRAFDMAKLFYAINDRRIDLFYGRPVDPEFGAFDDLTSDTERIWAVYATSRLGSSRRSAVDAYYIGYQDDDAVFNQGPGDEKRHTVGSRFFGENNFWDWNLEFIGQFGTFADGDIFAWSVASDSGYTFHNVATTPRLGLKANIISGDDDPQDADLQTFNPLFPKGKYFGEIGLIGPYNLINLHPSLALVLSKKWDLALGLVFYWRESTGDGLYNNGGILLRPDGGSDARYIGTQLDAALTYTPQRNFDVTLSGSAFIPGEFIEDTGAQETVYFTNVEFRFLF